MPLGRILSDNHGIYWKIVYHIVMHNFINLFHTVLAQLNIQHVSFILLVLIHTWIVKYSWQISISYLMQFMYPTDSNSLFSNENTIMICHYIKGLVSDSYNIFLYHESENINKKAYFQNFSWFQFYIFQCMIMCVTLLPQTAVLNKISCTKLSVKIAPISYWNDFSLIPLGSCAF